MDNIKAMALRDATGTATMRLAEERGALLICYRMRSRREARFALSEIYRLQSLLARLAAAQKEN